MFDAIAFEYMDEAREQGLTAKEGAVFVHAMLLEELSNGGRTFDLAGFITIREPLPVNSVPPSLLPN